MIDNLKTKIEQDKNINEIEISILGCYLPLNVSKIITYKLLNYSSMNKSFNDLIQIQIKDPLKEEEIKKSINSLARYKTHIWTCFVLMCGKGNTQKKVFFQKNIY